MAKRNTPAGKRRTFTPEFKAEVVELVRDGGQTVVEVARNLDLSETAVRGRVAKAESSGENSFSSDNEAELKRLQAENKRLRQERDILARTTAFFAKEST
jgi:transposase